ncbi:MAG: hypothetical protein A3G34_16025 [Candidatus Lindowbacteria bacterium RIFCSPLOWO2_12_FULL_62_27]|nr:MAG: hypothetical protein A3I06_12435 [Candidatus Lindowbacteria bacterium RIFCSPLOWO2_02_FULL_62_12]OGH61132.1 MAG: hypothetical protein A3G34_16025 [Candidatus Lindowbacteria bacterium RIFCSPLOWO2_12_FULL_62_27]
MLVSLLLLFVFCAVYPVLTQQPQARAAESQTKKGAATIAVSGPSAVSKNVMSNSKFEITFGVTNKGDKPGEFVGGLVILGAGAEITARGDAQTLKLGAGQSGSMVFHIAAPFLEGGYDFRLTVADKKSGASLTYPESGRRHLTTIIGPLVMAPATVMAPPGGVVEFHTLGGGNVHRYDFVENRSNGRIDPKTGRYVAGNAAAPVVDVVRVRDEQDQVSDATVRVDPGLKSVTIDADVTSIRECAIRIAKRDIVIKGPFVDRRTLAPNAAFSAEFQVASLEPRKRRIKLELSISKEGRDAATVSRTINVNALDTVTARFDMAAPAEPGKYRWSLIARDVDAGLIVEYPPKLYSEFDPRIPIILVVAPGGLDIAPKYSEVLSGDAVTFVGVGGGGHYRYAIVANKSGATIDAVTGLYRAGKKYGVEDVVAVYDEAGNSASGKVKILPPLTLSPEAKVVMVNAAVQFTATGGLGSYVFSVPDNQSGAKIDAATGLYTAGTRANVTDVVRVTDAGGHFLEAAVNVVPALEIAPKTSSIMIQEPVSFTATGGVGTLKFSIADNKSGAAINAATGAYTAGVTGGVTDVARVTDEDGNKADATVQVNTPPPPPAEALAPLTLTITPEAEMGEVTSGSSSASTEDEE